jgi:hypothetical protein
MTTTFFQIPRGVGPRGDGPRAVGPRDTVIPKIRNHKIVIFEKIFHFQQELV